MEEILVPNPKVVFRPLAGDDAAGVLLHLESGAYHGLNATGLAVWESLDGSRSGAEIARELRARFEDAPADLEGIVDGFLSSLSRRDLVVGAGSS